MPVLVSCEISKSDHWPSSSPLPKGEGFMRFFVLLANCSEKAAEEVMPGTLET